MLIELVSLNKVQPVLSQFCDFCPVSFNYIIVQGLIEGVGVKLLASHPLTPARLYRILWEEVYHYLPATRIVQYSEVQVATHLATPHGVFLDQHLLLLLQVGMS